MRAARKVVTFREDVFHEEGREVGRPCRRVWAAAVVANPTAGRFDAPLDDLVALSDELGRGLVERAAVLLEVPVEAYGKGAIVGTAGSIEAGHACLHPRLGVAVREALGHGRSMMPSSVRRAPAGASLDLPLHHVEAALVRSHFDTVEVVVPDAPHPEEIVIVVGVAAGGRPHARLGGLSVEQITVGDGLR